MIATECIDKVKETVLIHDIISQYVTLKKNGANYIGLSPFSNEKTPSFTVSESKNIYKCFSTGKGGDAINFLMEYKKCNYIDAIKLIAEKYGILIEEKADKKTEYIKPIWKNNTLLSDQCIKWFESRKISQSALNELKIGEGIEWMPQKGKEQGRQINTIQFNYFINNELINTKFRDGNKNFKMFKGAQLVMYNLDSVKNSNSVIIVEGEMDCLAMITAGYKNCISVPNGATKGKNNLTYLDNSIDYLDGKTEFILALDNDENGKNLTNELARRLGFENCTIVTFKDCKDANDCLIKYGIQGIIESMQEKKEFPIEGVFNAKDIEGDILNYYNNGLPKGDGIGMAELDMFIRFQPGYLTTITGIPGHGKSEFLDFILVRLNISHEWKVALYSPENHPLELHFSKFAEKIIGKPFEGHGRLSPVDLSEIIKYHSNNFFFINPKEDFTLDNILDSVRQLVRKKGIKAFVLDAWNKLDHKYTTNETKYISEQLDKITMFCEKNKVHCFLVAHPTKIQKDKQTGMYEVPNLYSISGSANFYNKTANGITVYRNFETGISEIYVQKVKFKHWGQTGCVHLGWNRVNGRYYKGTPNDDNWIEYTKTKELPNNYSFLESSSQDIITNNGINEDPF